MNITFIYPYALWLLLLVPLTAALALLGPRRPTPGRFWLGLVLRVFLLTLVVLALAGIQLRLPADHLTAVFLLDASDSVPADRQAEGERFIRDAISAMPPGDQAAVVVFGQDALVERMASEDGTLPGISSVPVTTHTDIAGALQLGLALFPEEGAKRMVLLSDGRETLGSAVEQAELAAAHGIQLTYKSLSGLEGDSEVLIDALQAPASVRQGQDFDLNVIVQSTDAMGARLLIFADGQVIHTAEVSLEVGINRFSFPLEAEESGFRRYRAQIIPDNDTRLQNNQASAFTVVHGPPHILVVEGSPEEGANLARALRAAEMSVTLTPPENLPTTLPELAAYDAIILANVPAAALPTGVMEALPVYVRDLGRGLVMTGGESSFGAGGYLRSPLEAALPVFMDVRAREQIANLALVMAVDKSGSMGKCHCENPDLDQSYTRQEVGQPKVDIAKEAVMRAAGALSEMDYLGVVTFDERAYWEVEVSPLMGEVELEQSIGHVEAFGGTNIRSGVEAAYAALQETDAKRKHVILLTDGWVRSGELVSLVSQMQEQGITLSVVAAGGGSAEYLTELAESGGGAYYPAQDILRVPDFFLKETVRAVGEYIVEEPFYPLPAMPSPALRGLDPGALPLLLGYNGTSVKNTARLDLLTPRGDPLLASWQYGLGRAVVWTSDMKGQWGTAWVTWDEYVRFTAQMVGWTLPAPQAEGLFAQTTLVEGQAAIQLEAVDEEGRPRNFLRAEASLVGPDLQPTIIPLQQTGAGRYEARLDVAQPGAYLVRLGVNDGDASLGQQTLGLVVPYSPEYRVGNGGEGLLQFLARLTGGSEGEIGIGGVFDRTGIPAVALAREIWRPLLLIVALLFPLDIAVRRVMFGSRDYARAAGWVRDRLPRRSGRPDQERALGNLFQARERARHRRGEEQPSRPPTPPEAPPPSPPSAGQEPRPTQPPARPAGDESDADTLGRLRRAKKRARGDE
jgi:uncharacterized membrane protein/Mg-chelatase subunit ChlD